MPTSHEATIAYSIRETWARPGLCASFEMSGATRQWLQYGDRRINARYPRQSHPGPLVAIMGGQLESWGGGRFLTVGALPEDADRLAHWISCYFQWVLGCESEAGLSVVLANFAGVAAS